LTNTRDLLIDKASAAMESAENDLTELLNPAAYQTQYISKLISSGQLDVNNRDQLADVLLSAVAGTPQILSLTFVTPTLQVMASNRETQQIITLDESRDPVARLAITDISSREKGSWGPLVYVPTLQETVLNFRAPVIQDRQFVGALIATITVTAVNNRMNAAQALTNGKRFILYGNDRVLLQQGMKKPAGGLSVEDVVPRLEEIEDPILKNIWSEDRDELNLLGNPSAFESHYLRVDGEGYIFIYKHLDGYADKTFTVGYWIRDEDVSAELRRLAVAGFAGLAIMLLGVAVAIIIGRRISRPVLTLSEASRQISKLDFHAVQSLPRSRFTEVNEANDAYNAMLRGLTWFETYVPKTLVRK
ncbi:MAG: hypothetical protein WD185_03345, partial [Sneathiella sp.]